LGYAADRFCRHRLRHLLPTIASQVGLTAIVTAALSRASASLMLQDRRSMQFLPSYMARNPLCEFIGGEPARSCAISSVSRQLTSRR
jgi:hypothetical protein